MDANPILLQMKYSRVVALLAKKEHISMRKALDIFYKSKLYPLVSEGVSDMHCMSDEYLADELILEYQEREEHVCGQGY